MKALYNILFFTLLVTAVQGQNEVDSLWSIWNNKTQSDISRLKALNAIIWERYLYNNSDSAIYYSNIELDLAHKIKDNNSIADAYNIKGIVYWIKSDYENATININKGLFYYQKENNQEGIGSSFNNLGIIFSEQGENDSTIHYYKKGLVIREKIGKQQQISSSLNNIGLFYYETGDYSKGIEYLMESLKIDEALGNQMDVSIVLSNIGSIYSDIGEFDQALSFFEKSLRIDEKLDIQQGVATSLVNIATIYHTKNENNKAIELYDKSIKICQEIGDESSLSTSFMNKGNIYFSMKDYEKAMAFYKKSFEIRQKIGNKRGISSSLCGIGNIWFIRENYSKAIDYGNRSYNIANEIESLEKMKDATNLLFRANAKIDNFKKAFEMQSEYYSVRDSLLSEKNTKSVVSLEYQYQYEKQKALDDIENKNQLTIAEEQKQKQKVISYSIGGVLFLLALFSYFIFTRMLTARKQKRIIQKQKSEVEQQKEIIEETHKEITDSIVYAKRIQQAIFPSDNFFKSCFQNFFILFEPKDVVSGDFYWLEKTKEHIFLAVADCTGHGVPGAMVSVVCHNALNRAVKEFQLTTPALILDKTKELVTEQFDKNNEDVKDGMDIALCVLNTTTNELQYAGANNPLWVTRKENKSLEVFSPCKQPIGKFPNTTPFKNHTIKLDKDDVVYLFSDGYADQFGGIKGKKFKQKPFKELLVKILEDTMGRQKNIISDCFEEWRGDYEQVDDVCVIGIRV